MFLNRALALDVDIVELDAAVVGLARRHFGFIDCVDSPRLMVRAAGVSALFWVWRRRTDSLLYDTLASPMCPELTLPSLWQVRAYVPWAL